MAQNLTIGKLALSHDPSNFDCENEELNNFIRRYATTGQRASISQIYVALSGQEIIGYHKLVVGNVVYEDAPDRIAKGVPHHPIPVLLLARLAVDRRRQGRGHGAALVADALRRAIQVANIAGVRAVLVRAKDDAASRLYEHLGFEPFPGEPLVFYRLMKDLRSMLSWSLGTSFY